jgi:hypothetical protein
MKKIVVVNGEEWIYAKIILKMGPIYQTIPL